MSLTKETKSFFDSFLKTEVKQANDTKTRKERRAEFERSLLQTTPTSELAARIEAAHQVVWVPEAYVLFKRHGTCRHCGERHECLDTPRLFLQQRKLTRDDTNAKMYKPVKEIEHTNLPWLVQISPVTVPYCLTCFEKPLCLKTVLLSPRDSISSSNDSEVAQQTLTSPMLEVKAGSNSEPQRNFQSLTSEVAFGGSPSEKTFGLGSERSELELPAVANG